MINLRHDNNLEKCIDFARFFRCVSLKLLCCTLFLSNYSLLILWERVFLWRKMAVFEINSLKFRVYQGFVMDVEYR